jgi:hypothetical protein
VHKRSLVGEIGYWKRYTELHGDPEGDFLHRAELNGSKFVIVKNVTVFKFPSTWRRDSYRERRCDEQAEYARRIQTEPDLLEREIIDTAIAHEMPLVAFSALQRVLSFLYPFTFPIRKLRHAVIRLRSAIVKSRSANALGSR